MRNRSSFKSLSIWRVATLITLKFKNTKQNKSQVKVLSVQHTSTNKTPWKRVNNLEIKTTNTIISKSKFKIIIRHAPSIKRIRNQPLINCSIIRVVLPQASKVDVNLCHQPSRVMTVVAEVASNQGSLSSNTSLRKDLTKIKRSRRRTTLPSWKMKGIKIWTRRWLKWLKAKSWKNNQI